MDQHPFTQLDGRPFEEVFDFGDDRISLGLGALDGRVPGDLIGVRVTPAGLVSECVDTTVDLPPDAADVVPSPGRRPTSCPCSSY